MESTPLWNTSFGLQGHRDTGGVVNLYEWGSEWGKYVNVAAFSVADLVIYYWGGTSQKRWYWMLHFVARWKSGEYLVWWMSYIVLSVVDIWCGGCPVWWMSGVVDVWCGGYLVWWMSYFIHGAVDVWCGGCLCGGCHTIHTVIDHWMNRPVP